jgi:hypothetical protein
MKTYGKWRFRSTILGLGTTRSEVVSFTPLPLRPMEIGPGTLCIEGLTYLHMCTKYYWHWE